MEGKSLLDVLEELYERFGVYREKLVSIKFPETKEGRMSMASALVNLREQPPVEFGGTKVVAVEDYQVGTKSWLQDGYNEPLSLPKSDVLLYWLEDESKLVVRPSGTEPKVKVYCGVVRRDGSDTSAVDRVADKLINALRERLTD